MENIVVYIKPKRNAEVEKEEVFLKDIASVTCSNETIKTKARALKVYQFCPNGEKRTVISALRLIELVQGLGKGIAVENVGEQDTLMKLVKAPETNGPMVWIKVAFVSLVSFFGTAFTIMAFHNDIGIRDLFGRFYEQGTDLRRLYRVRDKLFPRAGRGDHPVFQSYRRQADHEGSYADRGGNADL